MGKIGDLWIKLGLKKDELDKGFKSAEKGIKELGKGFSGLPNILRSATGAMGGLLITLGTALANALISGTEKFGDAWENTMNGMRNSYRAFISWVAGQNTNAAKAFRAGKAYSQAIDEDYEMSQGVAIAREKIQKQLVDLYQEAMDTNLPASVRKAAIEKYRALLEPIYEAEKEVTSEILDKAIDQWLAGGATWITSKSRVKKFFEDIGINPEEAKKEKDLYDVYIANKANNEAVFNALRNWYAAENGLDTEMKRLEAKGSRINDDGINRQKAKNIADTALEAMLPPEDALRKKYEENLAILKQYGYDTEALTAKFLQDLEKLKVEEAAYIQAADEAFDDEANEQFKEWERIHVEGLDRVATHAEKVKNSVTEMAERSIAETKALQQQMETFKSAGDMLDQALQTGLLNGLDELANVLGGVEGANFGSVIKAILSPLADAAVSAGLLILTAGKGINAFKESLTSLNGAAAVVAGSALIAVGVAAKAGLAAIGNGSKSSSGYASTSTSSSYANSVERQELTIYVKGTISGSDIVLAADRQRNKWNR